MVLVTDIWVLLVVQIEKRVQGLVEENGRLLQNIQVTVREVRVYVACRKPMGRRWLLGYILELVIGRVVENGRTRWGRVSQAMEHWLCRCLLGGAVCPPLSDVGFLEKRCQSTAYVANGNMI
jgi:hypothetical protein